MRRTYFGFPRPDLLEIEALKNLPNSRLLLRLSEMGLEQLCKATECLPGSLWGVLRSVFRIEPFDAGETLY